MSKFGRWINRRRHRRGFGVHSPLAYRVVKDALWPSPDYSYYAEGQIRRCAPKSLREPLLMAYRLSAMMDLPVEINGDIDPQTASVIPGSLSAPGPYLRLIIGEPSHPDPKRLLDPEGILMVIDGRRVEDPSLLPGELLFLLPYGWIAISRPGVPRNCYEF